MADDADLMMLLFSALLEIDASAIVRTAQELRHRSFVPLNGVGLRQHLGLQELVTTDWSLSILACPIWYFLPILFEMS